MNTREIKNICDARQFVEARAPDNVRVAVVDVDGLMRGKHMSRAKFLSALEGGFGFCNVVLGWDSNDQLYDNTTFTGWHTAYPDATLRIVPDSCRDVPFEPNTPLFLAEFTGPAEQICPRGLLRRVLGRAEAMRLKVFSAAEFEFFLFAETPESVRAKNYRDLRTITSGYFGYSVLRSAVHAEFYAELLQTCLAMDMPIEGLHTETGPGVLEVALTVDEALASADKAVLFKTFAKVIAQRRGWMATFMAKWSPHLPGQSGHLHVSLQDEAGRPVFHDPDRPSCISDQMRWFIGGQQRLMPELLAMVAPTVNSYTRLVPGFWAPTAATWGIENRTCALRAIPGSPKSQRVEYRISAADINPYIALAAAIGSGLWGIEHRIEPTEPMVGNAYEQDLPGLPALPRSLGEAAERLHSSEAARALFGSAFVDHYAATRNWEARESAKAITDWQLQRYFEAI